MRSATKTVGYGYVGRWRSGELGWILPGHLSGENHGAEPVGHGAVNAMPEERAVLCRITVEQVFRSDGRAIARRMRRSR